MQAGVGSKWAQFSKMEPLLGRTVSQIKNRFYQSLKGKNLANLVYRNDEGNVLPSLSAETINESPKTAITENSTLG